MSVQLHEDAGARLIELKVAGKLTGEDYARFAPEVDEFIRQQSRVRMLFQMENFHGWKLGGAWADFRFGIKHAHDVERLAVVGEKRWQRWSAGLCRLFTEADVRYFDRSRAQEAHEWLTSA
jgi:hypothetical protein